VKLARNQISKQVKDMGYFKPSKNLPKDIWEIINMDFVTGLPPGGSYSFNSVLVVVDRHSKRARFIPNHKDDTAMEVALLFWNRIMADVGTPKIQVQ
jgi:hypothetical protein